MATGVNKCILIGNVGMIESKGNITKASLATSESYKNKQGEKVDSTQWHRLVFFGKLAEIADKYVSKGDKLYIEGQIKYGKYTDNNGVERYSTDITVRNMQMLGSKKEGAPKAPNGNVAEASSHDDFEDDTIPF